MYKDAKNCHISQTFAETTDFVESCLFRGPCCCRI